MPGAAARGGAWQFEPLEKRILLSADPVQFLATLTDIDGDGVDEVIVGTHDAEQAGEQRGEVRVLSGADGSVLHTFAGEGQDSRFGWAVGDGGDLDGDGVHEIAVGAPGDGTLTFFSGSTGEVLVTLAGGQAGDGFGSSFAAAGDLNGDGYADWLVGVPGSDAASADGGEIQAVSGQWLADAASTDAGAGDYLLDVWSGAAPGVQVGSTLVALGDLDGDGDEDFAFGSAASGTLTLASWDNGGLQTQRVISGAGAVLAPVDDLDGDGIGDLLVGAPLAEGAGGEQAGSVTALSGAYLMGLENSGDGVLWSISGDSPGDQLGAAVLGVGDFDGDGVSDVLVGSPGSNGPAGSAVNAGAVLLVSGADGAVLGEYGGPTVGGSFGAGLVANGTEDGDVLVSGTMGAGLLGWGDEGGGDDTYNPGGGLTFDEDTAAAIRAGLDGLDAWMTALEDFDELDMVLPVANQSLGDLLELGQEITLLLNQVVDWLEDPTVTFATSALADLLSSLDGVSAVDSSAGTEINIGVTIDLERVLAEYQLALGEEAETYGIAFDAAATLQLTASLSIAFALRVDLSDDEFSIDNPSVTASLTGTGTDMDFGVDLGFLAAGIVGGEVSITGEVVFSFVDSSLTTDELTSDAADMSGPSANSSTVELSVGAGTGFDLLLPVELTATIAGLSYAGGGTIEEVVGTVEDVFSGDWSLSFPDMGDLLDFSEVSLDDVIEAFTATVGLLFGDVDGSGDDGGLVDETLPIINQSLNELTGIGDAVDAAIAEIQGAFGTSLQELEGKIEEVMAPYVSDVTLGYADSTLTVDLTYEIGWSGELAFALSLDDFGELGELGGDFLSVEAGGNVQVEATGAITFGFGIDLTSITTPELFVSDTTALEFTFKAVADDLEFLATIHAGEVIGDVGLWVSGGWAALDEDGDATTDDSASLRIGLAQGGDGRYAFNELGSGVIDASLTSGMALDLPLYFPLASMPLGGTDDDNNADGYADNVLHLGAELTLGGLANIQIVTPNLDAQIMAFSLINNPTVLLGGLDALLGAIQTGLNSEVLGASFPLIGDQLESGAQFIEGFRGDLVSYVEGAVESEETTTIELLQQAIFDAIGSILVDEDNNPISGPEGVMLEADPEHIQFNLRLAQTLATFTLPLDFGLALPGLGLEVDGDIQVDLDYVFEFGFGVDIAHDEVDGWSGDFYFDTTGASDSGEELALNLSATIPGLEIQGNIFFLQLSIEDLADEDGASGLYGSIGIDLRDPDGDGKLTGAEIAAGLDFRETVVASMNANANVDLFGELSLGSSAMFPSINTELHYDQTFIDADTTSSQSTFGGTPEIVFSNVSLDLGTFFSDFLGPVLGEVQKATLPLQPVIDILEEALPVLSDLGLGDTDGNGEVTIIELAALLGDPRLDMVIALVDLIDIINSIPTDSDSILINFGDFDLADLGMDVRNSTSGSGSPGDGDFDLDQALGDAGASSDAQDFVGRITESTGSKGGWSFPLIQSPSAVFSLLLGDDVDLFLYELPTLDIDFQFGMTSMVAPFLNVGLTGSVGVHAQFSFGYDTSGLRTFLDSDFTDVGALFDGFFITDYEGDELTLTADISAAAFAGIGGLVEVGAEGGIAAEIGFDLHDPDGDGKLRASELSWCIFEVHGSLTAYLRAYIWVGLDLGWFGKITLVDESWTLANVTLLDFNYDCPPYDPPPVATVDGSGTLSLNISDSSLTGDDDGYQKFSVREVTIDGQDYTRVTADGVEEDFQGVTRIEAYGTDLDESLTVASSVSADLYFSGSGGNDSVRYDGTGSATIYGGSGDDILSGGDGVDQLYGEAGNDTLSGNGGDDIMEGGDGADELIGGDGNDLLWGQAGDDILTAGVQLLEGQVYGGLGDNDQVFGGAGNDTISGGVGADVLWGEGDQDQITGGDGDDLLYGGDGQDDLAGGLGSDQVYGQADDDQITWYSGDGADIAVDGGSGADNLHFIGADGGESVDFSQSGSGPDVAVDWGGVALILEEFESIGVNAGMGADSFVINDLADTSVVSLGLDLGSSMGVDDEGLEILVGGEDDEATPDTAADVVLVLGTVGQDGFTLSTYAEDVGGDAGSDGLVVAQDGGLTLGITGASSDLDRVEVAAGAGDDILDAAAVSTDVIRITLRGEDDDDLLIGGDFADTLDGGLGDDTLTGNGGVDSFEDDGGWDRLFEWRDSDFALTDTSLLTSATNGGFDPLDGFGVPWGGAALASNIDGATTDVAVDSIEDLSATGGLLQVTRYEAGALLTEVISYSGFTTDADDQNLYWLDGVVRGVHGTAGAAQAGALVEVGDWTGDTQQTLWEDESFGRIFEEAYLTGGVGANTVQVSDWSAVAVLDMGAGSDEYHVLLTGAGFSTIREEDTGLTDGVDVVRIYATGGSDSVHVNADNAANSDTYINTIGDVALINAAGVTSLAEAVDATANTVAVDDTSDFSATGGMARLAHSDGSDPEGTVVYEYISYSGVDAVAGTLTGVERGLYGSQAASAEAGSEVEVWDRESFTHSQAEALDLRLGAGDDYVEVDDTALPLYVYGQDGADDITIGKVVSYETLLEFASDPESTTLQVAIDSGSSTLDVDSVAAFVLAPEESYGWARIVGVGSEPVGGWEVVRYLGVDEVNGQLTGVSRGQNYTLAASADAGAVIEALTISNQISVTTAMTNGVSTLSYFYGGADDDYFEVNHNLAVVELHGQWGDDLFVINANLEFDEDSYIYGGDGENAYQYVQNAKVYIDGGRGTDTVTINGTAAADLFIITVEEVDGVLVQRVVGAGVQPDMVGIEILGINGGGGNDQIFVYELLPDLEILITGGSGDDLISLGGPEAVVIIDEPEFTVYPDPYVVDPAPYIESFDSVVVDPPGYWYVSNRFPWVHYHDPAPYTVYIPIVVDPEPYTVTPEPYLYDPPSYEYVQSERFDLTGILGQLNIIGGSGEDTLRLRNEDGIASSGALIHEHLSGLEMAASGVDFSKIEFIDIRLGDGDDSFLIDTRLPAGEDPTSVGPTVSVRAGGGADLLEVQSLSGPTSIDAGTGDDTILAHDTDLTVDSLLWDLEVEGGTGTDRIVIDDRADGSDDSLVLTQSALTGLGLGGTVTYLGTEELEIYLGSGDDTAAIQGTTAITAVDTGGGDDELRVSSADELETGTLDDLAGALTLEAGSGSNTLLVSDAGSSTGESITVSESSLSGDHAGINYGATGGTFVGGLVISTGSGGDIISVVGTFRDSTETVIRAGEGDDAITVTLDATLHGALVVSGQGGRDHLTAADSTLGVTLDGGSGDDTLFGSAQDDSLRGGAGADSLVAGAGADTLLGDSTWSFDAEGAVSDAGPQAEAGADTLLGGAGADVLHGEGAADHLSGEDGDDILFGESGQVGSTAVNSTLEDGWADVLEGGAGDDMLLGGGGADTLDGGADADVLLGDYGRIELDSGSITAVMTTNASYGAGDTLLGDSGDDTLLGGAGDDSLGGGAGRDVLFGDYGSASFDAGVTTSVTTTDPDQGGDDTLQGEGGADILIGGAGQDHIYGADSLNPEGETEQNVLLGDLGSATWQDGVLRTATSSDPEAGAADTLTGGAGADVFIGGSGGDSLLAGSGNDLAIGDFGSAAWDAEGNLEWVETAASDNGGQDSLFGEAGDDVLLGAAGADQLDGAGGADVLVGDYGRIELTGGVVTRAETTDTDQGAGDDISGADDSDIILGGAGADTVFGGSGDDLVIGDFGLATWDESGELTLVETAYESAGTGGADEISGDDGDDVLMGAAGADQLDGAGGADVLVGDYGRIDFTAGVVTRAETTDTAYGAGDDLSGADDDDIVLGGAGADTVFGGSGDDLVIGDFGLATWDESGELTLVETAYESAGTGGADEISGDDGDDVLMGAAGADQLDGAGGADVLVGDYGRIDFTAGVVTRAETTTTDQGAGDDLSGADDNDIVLGGAGSDSVFGGTGDDLVIGDFGLATWDETGELTLVETAHESAGTGGADEISGDDGDDVLMGAAGADQLDGAGGADVLVGDYGRIDFTAGVVTRAETTTTDQGAGDDLSGADDNDIVLGGAGSDSVFGGTGDDLVIGDFGLATWDETGELTLVETAYEAAGTGGADEISGDEGADVLLGAAGADHLDGADGADVLVGDYGRIEFTAGVVTRAETTDTAYGAGDDISGANDNDIVLGGAGSDSIFGGTGDDLVIGDFGLATWEADGALALVQSALETSGSGGADELTGDEGDDVLVGAAGGDLLHGGAGDDTLLGDYGTIQFAGGELERVETTDYGSGGADELHGNDGADVLLGGGAGDQLHAGEGHDLALGDFGVARWSAGLLDTVEVFYTGAGAADLIHGDGGDDVLVGALGADSITGGAGEDVLFGDFGLFAFEVPGTLESVSTDLSQYGAGDELDGGSGNDVILAGTGADVVDGGAGADVILGDFGEVEYIAGEFTRAETQVHADGAGDVLRGGSGDDVILGAAGVDSISGEDGRDVLLGDYGWANYANGLLVSIATSDDSLGDADAIQGDAGDDVLLGGLGQDMLWGDDGADILVGDFAAATFVGGPVATLTTTSVGAGADDQMEGNAGNDILVGGTGADRLLGGNDGGLVAGADDDLILGDYGAFTFVAGLLASASASDTDSGGDDVLDGGAGGDTLLAGYGADTVLGGRGDDVILGDAGGLTAEDGTVTTVFTSDPDSGSADMLVGDDGNDTIFGGAQSDTIYGNEGDDVVVGDFGGLSASGGQVTGVYSTDAGQGAADLLHGNAGNDILLGGAGSDALYGNAGDDILLGDHGQLTRAAGQLTYLGTTDPTEGDSDLLFGADGDDVLLGGQASDTLEGNAGDDVLFGDFGELHFSAGIVTSLATTSGTQGGVDLLHGHAGDDIILGGIGGDFIYGDEGSDVALGDDGSLSFEAGEVVSIISTESGPGGADTILGAAGNDTLYGGLGDDTIKGNSGDDELHGDGGADFLFGDEGEALTDGAGTTPDHVVLFDATDSSVVGHDFLEGGAGDDSLAGGGGDDVLHGGVDGSAVSGSDSDVLIGDYGFVQRPGAVDQWVQTTDASQGGDDVLHGSEGADILLGGAGSDDLYGGSGADIIIGDFAVIEKPGADVVRIENTDLDGAGGDDSASGGAGDDTILGGLGSDTLAGDDDADILIGDFGLISISAGLVEQVETSHVQHGAGDVLSGGAGDDSMLGGSGADNLQGGDGADVLLGDFGLLEQPGGTLVRIENTDLDGAGGDDSADGGAGNDTILGGQGADELVGGADADFIVGDYGLLTVTGGQVERLESQHVTQGAADVIDGSDGADLILGGVGSDQIAGGGAADVILGDFGFFDLEEGSLVRVDTTDNGAGMADHIEGGSGADTLLGADGMDVIYGGSSSATATDDDDVIIGDYGYLTMAAGMTTRIETTEDQQGARDTLYGSEGRDTIFAGAGDDEVHGGAGADLIFGDGGWADLSAGQLSLARTHDVNTGDANELHGDEGDDTLVAGLGDDYVTGGDGDDVVFADNAKLSYSAGTLTLGEIRDPIYGGDDTVSGNAGSDILVGQNGNDLLRGGFGEDYVIGDNGRIELPGGELSIVEGTDPIHGGDDEVHGGGQRDFVIGGAGHDLVLGEAGGDFVFGDSGRVELVDGQPVVINTTDPALGGNDTVYGASGDDVVFGGMADDYVLGDDGDDILIGDNGRAFLSGGTVYYYETTDWDLYGDDTLDGGAGDDTLVSGNGDDTVMQSGGGGGGWAAVGGSGTQGASAGGPGTPGGAGGSLAGSQGGGGTRLAGSGSGAGGLGLPGVIAPPGIHGIPGGTVAAAASFLGHSLSTEQFESLDAIQSASADLGEAEQDAGRRDNSSREAVSEPSDRRGGVRGGALLRAFYQARRDR